MICPYAATVYCVVQLCSWRCRAVSLRMFMMSSRSDCVLCRAALFLAVQSGQLEKAVNIISNNALDINK